MFVATWSTWVSSVRSQSSKFPDSHAHLNWHQFFASFGHPTNAFLFFTRGTRTATARSPGAVRCKLPTCHRSGGAQTRSRSLRAPLSAAKFTDRYVTVRMQRLGPNGRHDVLAERLTPFRRSYAVLHAAARGIAWRRKRRAKKRRIKRSVRIPRTSNHEKS